MEIRRFDNSRVNIETINSTFLGWVLVIFSLVGFFIIPQVKPSLTFIPMLFFILGIILLIIPSRDISLW